MGAEERRTVAMSDVEVRALLEEERTLILATNGPRGVPHAVPVRYIVRDDDVWVLSYVRSQRVRNIERDPRATICVHAGEAYAELRGVMIECDVVVHRGVEVAEVGLAVLRRDLATAGADVSEAAAERMRARAAKSIAFQLVARRHTSWDHRKLKATGSYTRMAAGA